MLSDITSDEHDSPQCGHCGAPLAGRFTACAACNARPLDSLGARPPRPPPLKVPLGDSEEMAETHLPARKIWRPPSRALVDPYRVTEESEVSAPVSLVQRLRRPVVLSVSAALVTSAVYLGFIHTNDADVGPPIGVSGTVKAQNVKPPAVPAQRPAPVFAAQRPAPVTVQPRPAPVRPAPVRSPPTPPAVAAAPAARRVVVASASAKRNPGNPGNSGNSGSPGSPASPPASQANSPANNPPDKSRVDVTKQIRSARANLQQNNLAATRTRLAAAIAAQPDNRDALSMRETLAAREQQRDALLSIARGCGYIARWTCVWHNAGNALLVDSSSTEAQRLVSLAVRETEFASAWPTTPAVEPAPDDHDASISHH